MRSSMDDDDDDDAFPPPGTHERPLAFVKAALPMTTNTNDGFFLFLGKKIQTFFFCSLSRLGFLSKKRLSQFEPRCSRRKTNSRLRKARNLTTQRITKQTQRSLCEAKENAEMSFSCSNVLQSPSFARGGALHASSSSKTHKSKAAFVMVRAADDGTYFIVKPIHYAQFFRCIASKSAKNEEGRDVGVGKTNAS